MSKASDAGKAFMAGVFAKLPEGVRGQVETAFAAAEAEAALEVIGTGALAQPEINRKLDELRAKETEAQQKLESLNAWYSENKAALDEYVAIKPEYDDLKAKGGHPPVTPPATPPDPRKVAEDVINEAGREYVNVSAWLAGKAVEHSLMFNEALNVMELVSDPRLGKPISGQPGRVFSLQDAYTSKYGERVQQKAKEAEDKKFNEEVERRMAEERKKLTGQPFPLRDGQPSPSVLDVLKTPDGSAAHTVDTAIAEYERLQAARGVPA